MRLPIRPIAKRWSLSIEAVCSPGGLNCYVNSSCIGVLWCFIRYVRIYVRLLYTNIFVYMYYTTKCENKRIDVNSQIILSKRLKQDLERAPPAFSEHAKKLDQLKKNPTSEQ